MPDLLRRTAFSANISVHKRRSQKKTARRASPFSKARAGRDRLKRAASCLFLSSGVFCNDCQW
ncbi:hypothetical protein [Azospirillum argentinense]